MKKFSKKEIEKFVNQLNFSKLGDSQVLLPIITRDNETNEALILEYKIEFLT